jgi:DNA-3-methyladenine glycosylase II
VGTALQERGNTQFVADLPAAEKALSDRDAKLGTVIATQPARWPSRPTEDPIWGLVRIVMAQQISTQLACRLAEKVKFAHPHLTNSSPGTLPGVATLRAMGLPERRAQCCITILQKSDEIRTKAQQGQPWEEALAGIKGIGPWTRSVFRIMVLREPDVLPLGDVGLERAIANVYGKRRNVEGLGEKWRPFRSVACWYLWRTLGNEQLG